MLATVPPNLCLVPWGFIQKEKEPGLSEPRRAKLQGKDVGPWIPTEEPNSRETRLYLQVSLSQTAQAKCHWRVEEPGSHSSALSFFRYLLGQGQT